MQMHPAPQVEQQRTPIISMKALQTGIIKKPINLGNLMVPGLVSNYLKADTIKIGSSRAPPGGGYNQNLVGSG